MPTVVECRLAIDCAGPCVTADFVEALLRSGSRFDAFVIYAMGNGQQAKPSATRVRCPVDCKSLIPFESKFRTFGFLDLFAVHEERIWQKNCQPNHILLSLEFNQCWALCFATRQQLLAKRSRRKILHPDQVDSSGEFRWLLSSVVCTQHSPLVHLTARIQLETFCHAFGILARCVRAGAEHPCLPAVFPSASLRSGKLQTPLREFSATCPDHWKPTFCLPSSSAFCLSCDSSGEGASLCRIFSDRRVPRRRDQCRSELWPTFPAATRHISWHRLGEGRSRNIENDRDHSWDQRNRSCQTQVLFFLSFVQFLTICSLFCWNCWPGSAKQQLCCDSADSTVWISVKDRGAPQSL